MAINRTGTDGLMFLLFLLVLPSLPPLLLILLFDSRSTYLLLLLLLLLLSLLLCIRIIYSISCCGASVRSVARLFAATFRFFWHLPGERTLPPSTNCEIHHSIRLPLTSVWAYFCSSLFVYFFFNARSNLLCVFANARRKVENADFLRLFFFLRHCHCCLFPMKI